MEFEIHHIAEGCTVIPRGDLTVYSVTSAHAKLLEIAQEESSLILDMTGVSDIDSAGIQLLMSLKLYCQKHSKTLQIINHDHTMLNYLDLYGLVGFFADKVRIPKELKGKLPFKYGTHKIALADFV